MQSNVLGILGHSEDRALVSTFSRKARNQELFVSVVREFHLKTNSNWPRPLWPDRSSDSSRARRSVELRRKQQQQQHQQQLQQRCRHLNNANNGIDIDTNVGNVNNGGSCVVTLSDLCPRNTVVNSSGDAIQVERLWSIFAVIYCSATTPDHFGRIRFYKPR